MQYEGNLIELTPKEHDIDEILVWLKEESDENGESFYNNRESIYNSLKSGTAIALKCRGENIGLVIWSKSEIVVNIDIFVINSSYRGKGYGSFFYKGLSEYFRNEGIIAVKLFCMPQSSEPFWKRMGLHKYPDCGLVEHDLTYYGILIDTASTEYIKNADKIELWDVEPREAEGKQPKWIWYIERQDDELIYPIIQPSNCNWNLRWTRNGHLIKQDKIKYFTDDYNELYYSRFLYIENLEE